MHGRQPQFAVIGLGQFGESLALALVEQGCRVLGIDQDAMVVQRLSEKFPCIVIDTTSEEDLREVNITTFDAVVVAITTDFESNLMTTVALKNLGVSRVISLSSTDYQQEILQRVGTDRIIAPESDTSRRLARQLIIPGSQELMPLGPSHRVAILQVPASLGGKSLTRLGFQDRLELTVLAIQRNERSLVSPSGETVLLEGDLLVILGSNDALAGLPEF